MARQGGMAVRGVARKLTMAGGFDVPLDGLPDRCSGRTGISGEVLKPEMADAAEEATRLVHELQHALTSIAEDLHAGRHVIADERFKAVLLRVGDARVYVQHLAQQHLVPNQCPRCQAERTDDVNGDRMCACCVVASYGKPVVR
jgi:hypothetical protein